MARRKLELCALGLYFFVILAIEKQVGEKSMRRVPYLLRRLGTMLLIIFGWNIFYYTDMTRLVQNFGVMFGLYGAGFPTRRPASS